MYIMDTNTFITAKNTFYAYDIVPSFWLTLLGMFKTGKVKVIDAVADEIADGKDDLTEWFGENIKKSADDAGRAYVIQAKQDGTVLQYYQNIANLIMKNAQYNDAAKEWFLSRADLWLIATGKALNATVVTQEKMPGKGTTKVKIPDICQQVGVKYVNLYDMMRTVGIKI
ncbi:protein of unknown function [Selenomonas sp. WCT3]|nr:protein of unknown function [Selenomonas ruminantium]